MKGISTANRIAAGREDNADDGARRLATMQLIKQLMEQLRVQAEQLAIQEERLALQEELIRQLKDEIARLKGEQGRPQIRPSTLEKGKPKNKDDDAGAGGSGGDGKRPGSEKRAKTKGIEIHETTIILPKNIPPGSVFKGYQDYVVQGIRVIPHNTKFRLERWLTPEGKNLVGQLPEWIVGSHFDPELKVYVLQLHYEQHVTQPLLLEHLRNLGVDISGGQLNRLLTARHENFHGEKIDILRAGLEVSRYVGSDDTGGRHLGKNGYTTVIGNELFTWFETTTSKSRINFLKILRAGFTDYVIDEEALAYMRACSAMACQRTWSFSVMMPDSSISQDSFMRFVGFTPNATSTNLLLSVTLIEKLKNTFVAKSGISTRS